MNGGPGIGRRGKCAYIAGRERETDEATFLMCLVADAEDAVNAFMQINSIVTVKSTGEERVRYKVAFVNDKGDIIGRLYATFSMEDAKKYAYFDDTIPDDDSFEYSFYGSVITKSEFDSYVEMGVLPKLRVGTSTPKYP